MKTKKVLFLINAIKQSGPNIVLENMIGGLDKSVFEVYVISFLDINEKEAITRILKNGAKYISLDYPNKQSILRKGVKDLTEIIHDIRPDVIHSHGIFADYVNARLRENAIKVSTIHNLPFEDYVNRFGGLRGKLMARAHLLICKKIDHVVCCSETSYRHLRQYLRSPNPTYVRNSINRAVHWGRAQENIRKKIRQQYGINENDVVYVFAGGLVPGKNIRFLIDNFKRYRLKSEKLLLVGDGIERGYCEQNKDDGIIVVGFQSNVASYLCASDIYISASKSEGFSISILEALENGLALFLSDISAHREILAIDDGVYIGETFAEVTFRKDIAQLRKKYDQQVEKKQIVAFKNKYFTAKHMMKGYTPYYEGSSNEV